jgi:hypothetical protein
MKSIRYLIVFVLLGLLAWYFFYGIKSTSVHSHVKQPQVINEQNVLYENTKPLTQQNDKKGPQIKIIPEEDITVIEQKKDETLKSDYVSAFRDWQYFENCYTDVEDFNNKKDPLQTQAERFENTIRESQSEATVQQNSYYQYHVDICKSLIAEADDASNYFLIRSNLKSRYEKITPKTAEEKQLSHALGLIEQLNNFKSEYARAQRSQSSLSADEINTIQSKINALSDELLRIYEEGEELSEQQVSEIERISIQINLLKSKMQSNTAPDESALAEITAKIDGHLNSIDDYLHRVQSPDAFLILAKEIYKIEYFSKESTVMQNLKAQTGIYDSYYLNILNEIVLPLVACSMDYPCDAQSDLILSYCLGLRDSMFNQACGRNLEDFYFNYYIGGNQLNDVNVYFNYLVNRYAQ